MMNPLNLQPRRRFLVHLSLLGAAGFIGRLSAQPQPNDGSAQLGGKQPLALERVTREHFEAFVGSRFTITTDGGATKQAELIEATDRAARTEAPQAAGLRHPFSLLFRLSRGTHLTQDTYAIQHPGLGAFRLFLVPVGPAEGPCLCEAVFA